MTNKIIEYLEELNLSEIEAKLYVALLEKGPVSVRELASAIGLKRTTAYLYVDLLIEKGLVMKMVKGAQKQVAANPPDSLKELVEKKMESAKSAQKQLPDIMKAIHTNFSQNNANEEAEIRYYKGKDAVKKIYDEALKGAEFRLYVNLKELENLLMPNNIGLDYNLFENGLVNNPKLEIFEIIADDPALTKQFGLDSTAQGGRYFYKFMPMDVGLTAPGILLFDNKVAIINSKEGKPVCVVLYNADYYINSKKLFDYIWATLPKKSSA